MTQVAARVAAGGGLPRTTSSAKGGARVLGFVRRLGRGWAGAEATSPSPAFYLVSAAGMPNYGDDAITRYWIRYLRRRYPGCRIVLDAVDATVATVLHPTAICVDYVWKLAEWSHEQSPAAVREALRARWGQCASLPTRDRQVLALVRAARRVHVLGGGYINDLWPRNFNVLAVCAALADHVGARVVATGLGLEPLSPASASQVADLLDVFAHVDVRDAASAANLRAHVPTAAHARLSCLGDDLLQEDVGAVVTVTDASPRMHLCVQDELFAEPAAGELVRQLVLDEAASFRRDYPDAPIVCWELRPVFDVVAYDFLRTRVRGVTLVPFEQLWANGLSFGRADHLLSSRFHFQLLAAAAGVPGTALSWSGYYDTKFASLREFSRWRVCRLDEGRFIDVRYAEAVASPGRAAELGRSKRAFVDRVLYPSGWEARHADVAAPPVASDR